MKTIQKRKQAANGKRMGAAVAGLAKVVAIAGVTFAAMALKDKKTREKVIKNLMSVKNQTKGYFKTFKTDLNFQEKTEILKKSVDKSR